MSGSESIVPKPTPRGAFPRHRADRCREFPGATARLPVGKPARAILSFADEVGPPAKASAGALSADRPAQARVGPRGFQCGALFAGVHQLSESNPRPGNVSQIPPSHECLHRTTAAARVEIVTRGNEAAGNRPQKPFRPGALSALPPELFHPANLPQPQPAPLPTPAVLLGRNDQGIPR
jgi:hypothetical protein